MRTYVQLKEYINHSNYPVLLITRKSLYIIRRDIRVSAEKKVMGDCIFVPLATRISLQKQASGIECLEEVKNVYIEAVNVVYCSSITKDLSRKIFG